MPNFCLEVRHLRYLIRGYRVSQRDKVSPQRIFIGAILTLDLVLLAKLIFAFVGADNKLVEVSPGCGRISSLKMFSSIEGLKEAVQLAEYSQESASFEF